MKKQIAVLLRVVLCLAVFPCLPVEAQEPLGGGSNSEKMKPLDEISPQQRAAIIKTLQQNEAKLNTEGKIPKQNDLAEITLIWPTRQAAGFNERGYYGITNYVDQNAAFPNKLLDYNCGSRTYDLSSGYNHQGTDIAIWPFPWQKMAQNAVEVIAGAAGTIIGKSDGNPDQNCSLCTSCDWNAIYIRHSNGSVAWYGHLKTGKLTTKGLGETVEQGEYLGVVGSSGSSTSPHLHLELYTNSTYTQLVDPFAGTCNSLNGNTSWWANQQPYYNSSLLKSMTHRSAPNMPGCVGGEVVSERVNFANGSTVYYGSYFRDQQVGQTVTRTVYRPDNTVLFTKQQTFNIFYATSWWYDVFSLPNPAPAGSWRYEVEYNGRKHSTFFAVNSAPVIACTGSSTVLTTNFVGTYQWQLDKGDGAGFVNVTDDNVHSGSKTRDLQLKMVPSSYYGYQYRCLTNNVAGYTLTLKFVNYWNGNESTAWENPQNWDCGTVPDAGTDVVINGGLTNYPVISSNAVCRGTTVGAGAALTIADGFKLTVKGN